MTRIISLLFLCFFQLTSSWSQQAEVRIKDLTEGMYSEMKLNKEQKKKLLELNKVFITKRDSLINTEPRQDTLSAETELKIQELGKEWKKSIVKITGGGNFRRWFRKQNIKKEKLPYIDIWLSDQE